MELSEQKEGVFGFTENRDMAHFVRLCQQEQLYVILRPWRMFFAGWDLGGILVFAGRTRHRLARHNSSPNAICKQPVRYIAELAKTNEIADVRERYRISMGTNRK